MKKIQWAAGIILAFSVIVILLISSFEIAMYSDFGVYEREYEKYNVLNDLDMTMEDTMHVTREMMAYLRGDREELSVVTTVEGVEQDFSMSRTASICLRSKTFSSEDSICGRAHVCWQSCALSRSSS